MAKTLEELRILERTLAYENAASTIDTNLVSADDDEALDECRDWFDLSTAEPQLRTTIMEAIEYLESRGLIVHAEGRPNTIAVKDEHEEVAA